MREKNTKKKSSQKEPYKVEIKKNSTKQEKKIYMVRYHIDKPQKKSTKSLKNTKLAKCQPVAQTSFEKT